MGCATLAYWAARVSTLLPAQHRQAARVITEDKNAAARVAI